eukprot:gene3633-6449_t
MRNLKNSISFVKLVPEIIEFPTVLIDAKSLETKTIFHEYVKPFNNPQLTDFCSELTGIQQKWVDSSKTLDKVLENFDEWAKKEKLLEKDVKFIFVTCGDWDLNVMLPKQTKLEKLKVPSYFSSWINIKHAFRDYYKIPKSLGMAGMLELAGIPLDGHHHSGIDDSKNIAKILVRLIQDGAVLDITNSLKPQKKTQSEKFIEDLNWNILKNGIKITISPRPYGEIIKVMKDLGCNRIISVMSGDMKENPEKIGKIANDLNLKWNHIKMKNKSLQLEKFMEKEIRNLLEDMEKNEVVVIHCQNGIEKSGIFLYHLLLGMEMDSTECLEIIKCCSNSSYQYLQQLLTK